MTYQGEIARKALAHSGHGLRWEAAVLPDDEQWLVVVEGIDPATGETRGSAADPYNTRDEALEAFGGNPLDTPYAEHSVLVDAGLV